MTFPRIRLRTKLLAVAVALLAIPWVGYQYVRQMEAYLRQGQENALLGTANAVATVLHKHPELFRSDIDGPGSPARHFYVRALSGAIQLDGYADDWQPDVQLARHYGESALIEATGSYSPSSLSFRHLLGVRGNHLYALFQIDDEQVIYRSQADPASPSDRLEIGLVDKAGRFRRYAVSTAAPGWVSAYRVGPRGERLNDERRIQGAWQERAGGYTLELRIPRYLLGDKLGFMVTDVDDPKSRVVSARVGVGDPRRREDLATLVFPSPQIERILRRLEQADSRIWVVDRHRRVVAMTGTLSNTLKESPSEEPVERSLLGGLMHLVYGLILKRPTEEFDDPLAGASHLDGPEVTRALNGEPASRWRHSNNGRTLILSAAYPVRGADGPLGSVMVEKTSNAILTIQNRAMETLFNTTLVVFIAATLALLVFASRLSWRIRRLRNETEYAIGPEGRLRSTAVTGNRAGDEIGDLARSVNDILHRLAQYTQYLEGMASKLSHELRTPLTVVRSSLDNLDMAELPDEARAYTGRARQGLERLTTILNRLSEATRLEQALQSAEREPVDLTTLVRGCAEGYRDAYAEQDFDLRLPQTSVMVNAAPDLIAQALDKLVANGVEFSDGTEPVVLNLAIDGQQAAIEVINHGPPLPSDMRQRLFESMVSVREQEPGDSPHLGLGLYIARLITEFHDGTVAATNRHDQQGAKLQILLPLYAADSPHT